jgi:hypothetical protein
MANFILLLMIFLHILDDFKLQGALVQFKQKQWWEDFAPESIYVYDYIISLLIHSFSWAFMIMLPLAWVHGFVIGYKFISIFLFNIIFHAVVDDMKINRHEINLIQHQILNLIQIGLTWLILI